MARKDAGKRRVENIYEIHFYLRKNYSTHTEEGARIENIPQDDRFSFEEMSDYLKTFSKSVIEVENMTLKNKVLLVGGFQQQRKCLDAIKCVEKICLIDLKIGCLESVESKKQTMLNYKNLYKLMIIAPKLFNCRVNITHFVKKHDILLNYFQEIEEQTPWNLSNLQLILYRTYYDILKPC